MIEKKCIDCNKKISKNSFRCKSCSNKFRKGKYNCKPIFACNAKMNFKREDWIDVCKCIMAK